MSLFHAVQSPVDVLHRDAHFAASPLIYSHPSPRLRSTRNPLISPHRTTRTVRNNTVDVLLTERSHLAMTDPARDRDSSALPWPVYNAGAPVRNPGHGNIQGSAIAASSVSRSNIYPTTAANNVSLQPLSGTAGPGVGQSTASRPFTNVPPNVAGRPPADAATGTTLDQQPGSWLAASTARTRIFDPARDLNPTQPAALAIPPSSPVSSSARSETSRYSNVQVDASSTVQSVTSSIPITSNPPMSHQRQDPLDDIHSRYKLKVIEHPVSARASTYGDRDRRVINPPPILKLTMKDFNHENDEDLKQLMWPYNIVTCTLWRVASHDSPSNEWVEVTEYTGRDSRRQGGLMGTLVANPLIVDSPNSDFDEDSQGPPACYYVFSDLSCRTTGLFRLRFGLARIGDDFYKQVGARSPTIAYTWTEAFEVFSAKDFPGVRASSKLLRYLKFKGANVTIKKEGPPSEVAKKRARAPTGIESDNAPTAIIEAKRSRAQIDTQIGDREVLPLGTGFPDQNGPDD